MKTRQDIAHEECTRDPIFLFQRKVIIVHTTPPDLEFDGDSFYKSFEDPECEEDTVTEKEILDQYPDCALQYEITESVFLTREEGEAWGKAHDYNYPAGWQVYCVHANGKLIEVLNHVV